MNQHTSVSNAAKLNVAGLVLAATGMAMERGSGSTLYPTLAGPIVLAVVAALVAFRPARWTGYIGLIVPLVLTAGLIVSAAMSRTFLDQLTGTGNAGTLVGSILHVVGLVAAVAGGIGMVLRPHGDRIAQLRPR
jgi:hypothetical protein